jgi:plastocyanin
VFSPATKVLFALAGWAVASGVVYAAGSGDRDGFTLLVGAGVVAAALGLASFASVDARAAVAPVDEPAGADGRAERPVDTTDLPAPSPWPLVAAAALGVLAVGAAAGKSVVVLGLLVAAIATFGWLAQAWREHPSWTQAMTDRLTDRFVVPIGLPATVIVLVAVAAISFSRLLLALPKEAATFVALLAAMAILGVCAFVASRPRMGAAALRALATFSAVLVVAAGVAGAVKGEREFHPAGGGHGEGDVVRLVAEDIAFHLEELKLPASAEVKIELDNRDGAPHNLAVLEDEGGRALFRGEIVDGGKKHTYTVPPQPAGEYFFQCDVHPQQMKGRVVVAIEASKPAESGPMPPPPRP